MLKSFENGIISTMGKNCPKKRLSNQSRRLGEWMNPINSRKIALTILEEMDDKGSYSNISLNKKINNLKATYIDRRFISQLVYGVLENRIFLDHVIREYSTTKLRKINNYILNDLRMGAYQIIFLDKIPHSAAVNESVKLAKKKYQGLEGFVNGILRSIVRNVDHLPMPDREKDLKLFLSVKYSHPEWLVERWLERYGEAFTERLLAEDNKAPAMTIRANLLKTNPEQLKADLAEEGFITEVGKICKSCLKVLHMNKSIMESPLFEKGHFIVQDEGSSLTAEVMGARKGDVVLDVCAAPGGKTLYMAELMENQGVLVARDVYPHKLQMIEDNAKRHGITVIKPQLFDAVKLDKDAIGKLDKVLVDAPCSGMGIIRRKPEIRYNKNLEDITSLAALQKNILENAVQYLKVGGELVYSTCTLEPEENELVIGRFVEASKGAYEFVDLNAYLPDELKSDKPYIYLYPHQTGSDGFFISKIKKLS